MRFSWFVIGFISLVLLTTVAFSQINAPQSATLTASENTFAFSITNEKAQTLPVRFQVTGPFDALITPFNTSIGPNERQNFTAQIRLTPALEGQTYESTIVAKVGNQTMYQPITLHFRNVTKPESVPITNTDAKTGLFFLGGFDFSTIPAELLIDIFLILVLIIAIVAVAVRIKNRFRTTTPSEAH